MQDAIQSICCFHLERVFPAEDILIKNLRLWSPAFCKPSLVDIRKGLFMLVFFYDKSLKINITLNTLFLERSHFNVWRLLIICCLWFNLLLINKSPFGKSEIWFLWTSWTRCQYRYVLPLIRIGFTKFSFTDWSVAVKQFFELFLICLLPFCCFDVLSLVVCSLARHGAFFKIWIVL